jgi:hypothetical protein
LVQSQAGLFCGLLGALACGLLGLAVLLATSAQVAGAGEPAVVEGPPTIDHATDPSTSKVDDDNPTILGLPSDLFGLCVAVIAASIGLAQFWDSRRQRQLSELQSQREIGDLWTTHRQGWVAATMLVRGTGGYYALADPEVERLVEEYLEGHEGIYELPQAKTRKEWDAVRKPIEQLLRATLNALDGVTVALLSGDPPVRVAYDVIGPDYLRAGPVVREMVGWTFATRSTRSAKTSDDRWRTLSSPHNATGWLDYYPGARLRLLILLDLLWAEAARRADLRLVR